MSRPPTEEFVPLSDDAVRAVAGPHGRHAALIESAFDVQVETPGGGVRLREAPALRLDSGKARRRLGWHPIFGTARAVAETVRWYRGFYRERGFDALAFSRSQIQDFLAAGRARPWLW